MAGAPGQVGEEAGPAPVQVAPKILRDRTQHRHDTLTPPLPEQAQQPLGLFPREQADRRDAGRNDPARPTGIRLQVEARMGSQPAPHDCAVQAESVQQFRLVFRDPQRQQMTLPGRGGCLEAGQLTDDL